MQLIRKIIQIFFLLLIIIAPILNIYNIYFIKGSYISMDIGALAFSDPLAIFQAIFLSNILPNAILISVIIPILAVLILGRVWCSYACPYFLIVEFFDFCRKKLKLKSIKPDYVNSNKQNIVRFTLLVLGLVAAGIIGIPILYLFSPPSIISTQLIMLIKHFTLTVEVILIPIILILEFFLFYKFFCRFICPTGTFLSLFQRENLGIKVTYSGNCSKCNICAKVCPLILDPKVDGTSNQCNNCGLCIDNCKDNKIKKTLYFKIK